jgi:hypothetical protein
MNLQLQQQQQEEKIIRNYTILLEKNANKLKLPMEQVIRERFEIGKPYREKRNRKP